MGLSTALSIMGSSINCNWNHINGKVSARPLKRDRSIDIVIDQCIFKSITKLRSSAVLSYSCQKQVWAPKTVVCTVFLHRYLLSGYLVPGWVVLREFDRMFRVAVLEGVMRCEGGRADKERFYYLSWFLEYGSGPRAPWLRDPLQNPLRGLRKHPTCNQHLVHDTSSSNLPHTLKLVLPFAWKPICDPFLPSENLSTRLKTMRYVGKQLLHSEFGKLNFQIVEYLRFWR